MTEEKLFESHYVSTLKQLEQKGKRGTMLVRFHSDAEYRFYHQDRVGLPFEAYNRMLTFLFKQLSDDGYFVSIVAFDPVSYEEWLGEMPVEIPISSTDPYLLQAWALTQLKEASEQWGPLCLAAV